MGLSTDLISQFVKATQGDKKVSAESTVYGTVVKQGDDTLVQLDGSDVLTPVESTVKMESGDRVIVAIKNHTATVTGNLTNRSAGSDDVDDVIDKISEFEIIIADKASIGDLDAERARIDELVTDNIVVKDRLTASEAIIAAIEADNVVINEKLTATEAEIGKLSTGKLDADFAEITYATITDLNATNATIHNLEATYGDFAILTTDKFTAIEAAIGDLEVDKLSVTDAEMMYANIDFANIGDAAIENFFSKSGIIGDLVVSDGVVTGTLVGVTIKGDLIEGGTIVADKLILLGEDGLYYRLNTDGETVETEQTDYNSINGSVITAQSITASKIHVDDLVAFGATIGGFKITENAIYSGVKESATNTTRGAYLDNQGQVAFGDASNFLRYYKNQNGEYKLEISASSIKFGAKGESVEDAFENIEVGARNLIRNSATIIFHDYYFESTGFTTNMPTTALLGSGVLGSMIVGEE